VAGGALPAGVADRRWVYWQFLGRSENLDLYFLALVDEDVVLQSRRVAYEGGDAEYDIGGVNVRIARSQPQ